MPRMHLALAAAAAALIGILPVAAADLPVFQGLEEATARIPRLKEKPYERLIGADGTYAPEILIFHDTETGAEIWSLTQEECTELANIERRSPWNANGSILSFIGNRAYRGTDGKLVRSTWSGYNYVMSADGTNRRRFWATNADGSLTTLTDKFNNWDRRAPGVLYFVGLKVGNAFQSWTREAPQDAETWLVRVRVSDDLKTNRVEPIYRFPNSRRKIIQNISDDNRLCIQDVNGANVQEMPLFYVVDLNVDPKAPGFARSHPLAYGIRDVPGHDPENEYRVHGITISRDGKRVGWNYGSMTDVGEPIGFSVPADDLDARPAVQMQSEDAWGQYLSHPDSWRDGRIAYFGGPTDKLKAAGIAGGWGIWIRVPGKDPVYSGVGASGGHITWCGGDPDWFFANISRPEKGWDTPIKGRIVAGKADGSALQVLCNPFDRLRGGKAGYDAIPRAIQSPDATKCWYHSSMLMSGDQFTGSYIAVFRRPHAPVALTADTAPGSVVLTWKPHAVSAEVKGYHVYVHGAGEIAPWRELTDAAVPGTSYIARGLSMGWYQFAVTAEEHSGLESEITSPVVQVTVNSARTATVGRTSPKITGWDRTPPRPVAGLTVTKDATQGYRLRWRPAPEKDVRYYNVYFSAAGRPEAVQARRIVSPPRAVTEYWDWAAPKDGPTHYAVTAVDRQGNESAPAHGGE